MSSWSMRFTFGYTSHQPVMLLSTGKELVAASNTPMLRQATKMLMSLVIYGYDPGPRATGLEFLWLCGPWTTLVQLLMHIYLLFSHHESSSSKQ